MIISYSTHVFLGILHAFLWAHLMLTMYMGFKIPFGHCLPYHWWCGGWWSSLNFVGVGLCTAWSLLLGGDYIVFHILNVVIKNIKTFIWNYKSYTTTPGTRKALIQCHPHIMPLFFLYGPSYTLILTCKFCTPPSWMLESTFWAHAKASIHLACPYQYNLLPLSICNECLKSNKVGENAKCDKKEVF